MRNVECPYLVFHHSAGLLCQNSCLLYARNASKQNTEKNTSLFFAGSWPIPRAKWGRRCCCVGRIRQKDQICTGHGNWCAIASEKYSLDLHCLNIMFFLICGNRYNCIALAWVKWLLLYKWLVGSDVFWFLGLEGQGCGKYGYLNRWLSENKWLCPEVTTGLSFLQPQAESLWCTAIWIQDLRF